MSSSHIDKFRDQLKIKDKKILAKAAKTFITQLINNSSQDAADQEIPKDLLFTALNLTDNTETQCTLLKKLLDEKLLTCDDLFIPIQDTSAQLLTSPASNFNSERSTEPPSEQQSLFIKKLSTHPMSFLFFSSWKTKKSKGLYSSNSRQETLSLTADNLKKFANTYPGALCGILNNLELRTTYLSCLDENDIATILKNLALFDVNHKHDVLFALNLLLQNLPSSLQPKLITALITSSSGNISWLEATINKLFLIPKSQQRPEKIEFTDELAQFFITQHFDLFIQLCENTPSNITLLPNLIATAKKPLTLVKKFHHLALSKQKFSEKFSSDSTKILHALYEQFKHKKITSTDFEKIILLLKDHASAYLSTFITTSEESLKTTAFEQFQIILEQPDLTHLLGLDSDHNILCILNKAHGLDHTQEITNFKEKIKSMGIKKYIFNAIAANSNSPTQLSDAIATIIAGTPLWFEIAPRKIFKWANFWNQHFGFYQNFFQNEEAKLISLSPTIFANRLAGKLIITRNLAQTQLSTPDLSTQTSVIPAKKRLTNQEKLTEINQISDLSARNKAFNEWLAQMTTRTIARIRATDNDAQKEALKTQLLREKEALQKKFDAKFSQDYSKLKKQTAQSNSGQRRRILPQPPITPHNPLPDDNNLENCGNLSQDSTNIGATFAIFHHPIPKKPLLTNTGFNTSNATLNQTALQNSNECNNLLIASAATATLRNLPSNTNS